MGYVDFNVFRANTLICWECRFLNIVGFFFSKRKLGGFICKDPVGGLLSVKPPNAIFTKKPPPKQNHMGYVDFNVFRANTLICWECAFSKYCWGFFLVKENWGVLFVKTL